MWILGIIDKVWFMYIVEIYLYIWYIKFFLCVVSVIFYIEMWKFMKVKFLNCDNEDIRKYY